MEHRHLYDLGHVDPHRLLAGILDSIPANEDLTLEILPSPTASGSLFAYLSRICQQRRSRFVQKVFPEPFRCRLDPGLRHALLSAGAESAFAALRPVASLRLLRGKEIILECYDDFVSVFASHGLGLDLLKELAGTGVIESITPCALQGPDEPRTGPPRAQ